MALNWVATARKAGVEDLLIGALDARMMDECAKATPPAPCVLINGGSISALLHSDGAAQNLRSRPSLYPKMSVLKVGFYRELLSYGAEREPPTPPCTETRQHAYARPCPVLGWVTRSLTHPVRPMGGGMGGARRHMCVGATPRCRLQRVGV